ncbi:MAG: hypothetical protein AB7F43_08520 [Bacteriovoracia bacterium]
MWKTLLGVVLVLLTLPSYGADSLSTRTGYTSQKQVSAFFSGSFALQKQITAVANLGYSRTPLLGYGVFDKFITSSAGVNLAVNKFALELLYNYSYSTISLFHSHGATIAFTYIFSEDDLKKDNSREALALMHTQIYEPSTNNYPVLWMRAGGSGNYMSSLAIDKSGIESDFFLEVYSPQLSKLLNELVTLGLAGIVYSYDDSDNFFTGAQRTASNLSQALLGSTIQGLPLVTVTASVMWQIASLDTFITRYQHTQMYVLEDPARTIGLGWRHRFSKHFYLTPDYSMTFQGDYKTNAVGIDFSWIGD